MRRCKSSSAGVRSCADRSGAAVRLCGLEASDGTPASSARRRGPARLRRATSAPRPNRRSAAAIAPECSRRAPGVSTATLRRRFARRTRASRGDRTGARRSSIASVSSTAVGVAQPGVRSGMMCLRDCSAPFRSVAGLLTRAGRAPQQGAQVLAIRCVPRPPSGLHLVGRDGARRSRSSGGRGRRSPA
jgi:hypothetical protein